MAKNKPPQISIKVTPTPKTQKGNQYQAFINHWRAKYPKLTPQLAQSIYLAAKAENLDPIEFAALILNESSANPNTPDSAKGAIGLGQLEKGTFIGPKAFNGGVEPWNKNHKITEADLRNQGINLRLSAAYYASLKSSHPTDAYGAYNAGPNAKGDVTQKITAAWWAKWVTPWNKQYIPGGSTSPPGKAGQQVPGGTAQPAQDIPFKDPFVAGINKQGKFVTTHDPNKAAQGLSYDGMPLTITQFKSLQDQLSSWYVSYTGKRPSSSQIQNFLRNNWSTYQLTQRLSEGPNFKNSPIYKQKAAALNASVAQLLPEKGKVPDEIMRQAILHDWDATTVAAKLRQLPGYTQSNEFKGNVATLLNVHQSIMGTPDQSSLVAIKDAALQGWTTDQYAAWLRSQPSYTQSTEYQSKALGMLGALGLITGQQAVLKPGASAGPGAVQPASQNLPPDKRITGIPSLTGAGDGLGATLG